LKIDSRGGLGYIVSGWYIIAPPDGTILLRRLHENAQYGQPDTSAGVTPIGWCIERLDKNIKVVSPEELLWRLRMEHNPIQTRKAIDLLKKQQSPN